jgi:hypothetical protein
MTGNPPAPSPAQAALQALIDVDAALTQTMAANDAAVKSTVDAGRAVALTWQRIARAMNRSTPWVVRVYGPRRAPGENYPRRTEPTVAVADLPAAQEAAYRAIEAAAHTRDRHREQAVITLRDAVAAALEAGNTVAACARVIEMDRANLHRWFRDLIDVQRHVVVTVRAPDAAAPAG